MAVANDDCSVVVVHRGKLVLTVYDCSGASASKKGEIDLAQQVSASGNFALA